MIVLIVSVKAFDKIQTPLMIKKTIQQINEKLKVNLTKNFIYNSTKIIKYSRIILTKSIKLVPSKLQNIVSRNFIKHNS